MKFREMSKFWLYAEANTGIVSTHDALSRADENADITVHCAKNMISIRFNGDLIAGSSVRVYNILGQQIADLTDRMTEGQQASLKAVAGSTASLVVLVQKGGRIFCRRVLVTE